MPNNNCYVEFDFEFEPLESKLMQVTVGNNHNKISAIPQIVNGKYLATAGLDVILPTQITLEFNGKNQNTDTVVDANGNIVKDLLVKISAIKLDGLVVGQNFLHNRLKLTAIDNSEWIGPIVGFNGTMNIDFAKDNVFSQYLNFLNQWT